MSTSAYKKKEKVKKLDNPKIKTDWATEKNSTPVIEGGLQE